MECPACHRVIYSRSQKKCGYCGILLPDEFRLSPEELAAVKQEQTQIEKRRAARKAQEEKEREENARKRASDGYAGMMLYLIHI